MPVVSDSTTPQTHRCANILTPGKATCWMSDKWGFRCAWLLTRKGSGNHQTLWDRKRTAEGLFVYLTQLITPLVQETYFPCTNLSHLARVGGRTPWLDIWQCSSFHILQGITWSTLTTVSILQNAFSRTKRLCPPDCLKSLGESWKVCTPIQGRLRILNPHWGHFYF